MAEVPRSTGRDPAGSCVEWSDEALMHAISARDHDAFDTLYDRYADLVYVAALRVLGDPQLAEDATQDVFLRIWRHPDLFVATRGRFLSWVMSVTRNRALDECRARRRRLRREGSSLEPPAEAHETVVESIFAADPEDPQSTAQLHEDQARVRAALCILPEDQRRVLELAYFGGLTQQEIAAGLHEPLGTVKTRIRLGMQKLRRALEPGTSVQRPRS